jgi:hypothetical protein
MRTQGIGGVVRQASELDSLAFFVVGAKTGRERDPKLAGSVPFFAQAFRLLGLERRLGR